MSAHFFSNLFNHNNDLVCIYDNSLHGQRGVSVGALTKEKLLKNV